MIDAASVSVYLQGDSKEPAAGKVLINVDANDHALISSNRHMSAARERESEGERRFE